ncbi:MAG: hypothetical protein IKI75_08810 [Lachnospiraceae bacterium]|nr:hypothetical protein [Lachnospiraceae bacterium]
MRENVRGNLALKRERQYVPNIHPIYEERKKARKKIHYGFSTVLVFLAAAAVMAGTFFQVVSLQTDVTLSREEYSKKLSQYEDLKRSNDLYRERIMSRVDMNEIERIARDELGMSIAREGQIVIYSGQIDDYVKQYEDVPGL